MKTNFFHVKERVDKLSHCSSSTEKKEVYLYEIILTTVL